MLKKLLLAAVLVMPSLAFAADGSAYDRRDHRNFDYPNRSDNREYRDYREYQVSEYRKGRSHQRAMIERINEEQTRQRDRVIQGVRSGELTPREADRLRDEQAKIRELEQRYMSDRFLSQREFAKLQEELRESSRHILAEKTDRQDRGDYQRHSSRY